MVASTTSILPETTRGFLFFLPLFPQSIAVFRDLCFNVIYSSYALVRIVLHPIEALWYIPPLRLWAGPDHFRTFPSLPDLSIKKNRPRGQREDDEALNGFSFEVRDMSSSP